MREETHCCHMGYSFRLAARVILYASSHREDNTYHGLCYTSRGALAGREAGTRGRSRQTQGNVLFIDALNAFYLWLYGVGHMVKEHSYSKERKGNALFNDALNTFYIWLYGVRHMVKEHSYRQETSCQYMGYSFLLAARVLLNAQSLRLDSTYRTTLSTQVVEHWLERKITQWVHYEGLTHCTMNGQNSTHHHLCYTSRGALAGMRSIHNEWIILP